MVSGLETLKPGFLHQLVSFEFLLTFNVTMRILSSLRFLTVMLQKKSNDILTAYEHVSDVLMDLELLKTNCEDEFHLWFNEIKILADSLNIAINTPRTPVDKFIVVTLQLTVQKHSTGETLNYRI